MAAGNRCATVLIKVANIQLIDKSYFVPKSAGCLKPDNWHCESLVLELSEDLGCDLEVVSRFFFKKVTDSGHSLRFHRAKQSSNAGSPKFQAVGRQWWSLGPKVFKTPPGNLRLHLGFIVS